MLREGARVAGRESGEGGEGEQRGHRGGRRGCGGGTKGRREEIPTFYDLRNRLYDVSLRGF